MGTKQSSARQVKATRTTRSKRVPQTRLARPLHKRILLHPLTVFVLLCVGVLVFGATFHTKAESYNVTATVPAVPPASAAVLTLPWQGQHVSAIPFTAQGRCPDQTYVKLYRNNAFSGAVQCSSQSFSIQTHLAAGANQIEAKVYSITDQPGPPSAAVTMYLDDITTPAQPTPTSPPTELHVSQVDAQGFQQGGAQRVSTIPTVSGFAPPYATIIVTFHSVVSTCKTQADNEGRWSCTLDHALEPGIHTVEIMATTQNGQQLVFPSFTIQAVPSLASLLRKLNSNPLSIITEYSFVARRVGQHFDCTMRVSGGTGPYFITVDWGDGQTSTLNTSEAGPIAVSHIYQKSKQYVLHTTVRDHAGQTATMQTSAVILSKNVGFASVTAGQGWLPQLLTNMRAWLWVVWPTYALTIFMAISFWLGEREEYRRLARTKRARATR